MSEENKKPTQSSSSSEWTTWFYSTAGIVILFALVVGINLISSSTSVRVDLTEDKIFTLSQGTRNILKELDTPVTIRFFATKDQDNMPPVFRSYAQRIEDLLSEYDKVGGKNIKIEKYDPEPLSDAEDIAKLDGIQSQQVDLFDRIYLGLSVKMLDQVASIPFLAMEREKLLEYDISRMITQVTTPEKAKIGVISSLPLFGSPMNPMMMQQGQRPQQPWIVINQLRNTFEVTDLTVNVESVPEDIEVLIVVHPKNLSNDTMYAIDQYLMKGGKLMVMTDPAAITDTSAAAQNQMQALMQNGSNLEKLYSAWGITFTGQVVADRRYATQVAGRDGRPEEQPGVLQLDKSALSDGDVLTTQVDNLVFVFAGAFTGEPTEGIKRQDLVTSSEESQLVEAFMVQMSGKNVMDDFKADDKKYALVSRLTGTFPSAFPDGKPKAEEATPEGGANPETGNNADNANHLTTSTGTPSVLLVGDVDFVYDQFSFRVMNFLGQAIAQPSNGNAGLFFSMAEQLSGDENLIEVRGRATLSRPFTKFKELRLEAEKKVEEQRKGVQQALDDARQKIQELQGQNQGNSLALSPEQSAALKEFRQKEFEANKELKEIQKQLNKDIDEVRRNWQITQIVLVPFFVAFLGVVTAIYKRYRTAAK